MHHNSNSEWLCIISFDNRFFFQICFTIIIVIYWTFGIFLFFSISNSNSFLRYGQNNFFQTYLNTDIFRYYAKSLLIFFFQIFYTIIIFINFFRMTLLFFNFKLYFEIWPLENHIKILIVVSLNYHVMIMTV